MTDNVPSMLDFIERTIRLSLGNPIMLLCEKEKEIKEDAMHVGLMDYYRACPFIQRTFHNLSGMEGLNISIPFAQPIGMLDEKVQPHAYYIGVVRADVSVGMSYQGLYSFDNYLLGTPLINPLAAYSGSGNLFSRTDFPLKQLAYTTTTDLTTGEPSFIINRTTETVDVIGPVTIGQLMIEHGLGFYCWDKIEPSHVDLVSKFICKRLLESVITARTTIKLKSDFDIDVSSLEKQLEKIETYLKEETSKYQRNNVLWG